MASYQIFPTKESNNSQLIIHEKKRWEPMGDSRAPRFGVDDDWVFSDCLLDGLFQSRAERSGHGSNRDGSRFRWSVDGESSSSVDCSAVAHAGLG